MYSKLLVFMLLLVLFGCRLEQNEIFKTPFYKVEVDTCGAEINYTFYNLSDQTLFVADDYFLITKSNDVSIMVSHIVSDLISYNKFGIPTLIPVEKGAQIEGSIKGITKEHEFFSQRESELYLTVYKEHYSKLYNSDFLYSMGQSGFIDYEKENCFLAEAEITL